MSTCYSSSTTRVGKLDNNWVLEVRLSSQNKVVPARTVVAFNRTGVRYRHKEFEELCVRNFYMIELPVFLRVLRPTICNDGCA